MLVRHLFFFVFWLFCNLIGLVVQAIEYDIKNNYYQNHLIPFDKVPIAPNKVPMSRTTKAQIALNVLLFLLFLFFNHRHRYASLLVQFKLTPQHIQNLGDLLDSPGKVTSEILATRVERVALYLLKHQEDIIDGISIVSRKTTSFARNFVKQHQFYETFLQTGSSSKCFGFGAPHQLHSAKYQFPLFVSPRHSRLQQDNQPKDSLLVCFLLNNNSPSLKELQAGSNKVILLKNLRQLVNYQADSVKGADIFRGLLVANNLKRKLVEWVIGRLFFQSSEKALNESAFILLKHLSSTREEWPQLCQQTKDLVLT